jgi:DNA-binding GntR family transcriptional regulator
LAIMRNWLPPTMEDLTADQLEEDGLYAVLRARGIRPTVARQRIGARNATAEERRTLHMSKAEPLVTMTRSAYDADGSPVEFGDHCYRADQYSVEVVVSDR